LEIEFLFLSAMLNRFANSATRQCFNQIYAELARLIAAPHVFSAKDFYVLNKFVD